MKTLNIITPCSRPENLEAIYVNLCNYAHFIQINWWIVFDKSIFDIPYLEESCGVRVIIHQSPHENAIGGHLHRNFIFRILNTQIPGQWCYMLDDDNLIHPKLIEFFVAKNLDNYDILFFSMQKPDGKVMYADFDRVRIGYVDTAMIAFRTNMTSNFNFSNNYTADGEFIQYLYKNFKSHICHRTYVMAYHYNKLENENRLQTRMPSSDITG